MEMMKLMEERHSVRQYEDKRIEDEKRKVLVDEIEKINRETGLHVQIFFDEPKCFDSLMAHYGKFTGVQNYIALVGKKAVTWMKSAATMENSWYYWLSL